jgi:hypothetical protein
VASVLEKQELVDDIKRPTRRYSITVNGAGGEIYYGRSSKEEYEYWVTNADQRRTEVKIGADENPFQQYMLFKDNEPGMYLNVPETVRRDYNSYYEYYDLDNVEGPAYDSAYITIKEIDDKGVLIETLYDNVKLEDFIIEHDIETIVDETVAFDNDYVYSVVSDYKTSVLDGVFETQGRADLTKLNFFMSEMRNGQTIIYDMQYNNIIIDNLASSFENYGIEIRLLSLDEG